VVVTLECDDEQTDTLTLTPGATAGTLVSSDVLAVSAGTTCTVTEVADGTAAGSGVAIMIGGAAIVEGTPSSPVTVDAGDELVVAVVNTYTGTEVLPTVVERPVQVAPTTLPRTGGDSDRLMLLAGLVTTLGGLLLLGESAMDQRRRRMVLRRR
jgi:LPXTG-motif cell wall-anchored protein